MSRGLTGRFTLSLSKQSRLWLSSLMLVLMIYVAPLVWWLWPDTTASSHLPPPAAMVVEIAAAPVAPPTPADLPPGPEQTQTQSIQIKPEPVKPVETEIPAVENALDPEVVIEKVKPPVEPEPKPQEPPIEPQETAEPENNTDKKEQLASSVTAPPKAPEEDVKAAAPNQGVSNPVVDTNQLMSWQASLMMKINQAKQYPSRARRSRQEGTVFLKFSMNRAGHVLTASIAQSSGYSLLDKETLAMIERAQPLPVPPTGMQGALEFVVPVEFFLN
ncbi:energy transducer TonB [Catenovulum sp. 2E275]|uniref:energy transducer TonB n=1 Tax=Catenovulum sp. 2E275 TaxID=2980497 RepID=UPI0021CE4C93|nr:energy transducer TonB [Catenovulum sp. 2E275]MCU4675299.1 energy transducer TonB [Catenovulum sp. 2E275]